MNRETSIAVLLWASAWYTAVGWAAEAVPPGKPAVPVEFQSVVKPKEISTHVKQGLAWLVSSQHEDGSWGQGEESVNMGGGAQLKGTPNVADSCIATLALLRSGSTPKDGEHAKTIQKAIEFVSEEIAKSEDTGLFITSLRGTRTQTKLGQFIDTFLAAQVLAQVKDKMPDDASTRRVAAAFNKVMDKIEKNQKSDGSWASDGWANALSQSMGQRALNAAKQNGRDVPDVVLKNANDNSRAQAGFAITSASGASVAAATAPAPATPLAVSAGDFAFDGSQVGNGENRLNVATGLGGTVDTLAVILPGAEINDKPKRPDVSKSAGVELYSRASSLAGMQDFENTSKAREPLAHKELHELDGKETAAANMPADDKAKALKDINDRRGALNDELKSYGENRLNLATAQTQLIERMEDKQFASGFGSNGGEEFLSYMQIGESLVTKGGDAWEKWDKEMTGNLERVQNEDGTWSGHHCITGRTFCTSAALLVMMTDRAQVPVGQKITR